MITHYGLFWSEADVFWESREKEEQALCKAESSREPVVPAVLLPRMQQKSSRNSDPTSGFIAYITTELFSMLARPGFPVTIVCCRD